MFLAETIRRFSNVNQKSLVAYIHRKSYQVQKIIAILYLITTIPKYTTAMKIQSVASTSEKARCEMTTPTRTKMRVLAR